MNLKKFMDRVSENLETRIYQTKGTIVLNNLPTLEADPLQMQQLFQNLIVNGLKYHREGVPPQIIVDSFLNKNGMWESQSKTMELDSMRITGIKSLNLSSDYTVEAPTKELE